MMGLGTAACFWGRLWLLLALCVARCGANREKAVTLAKAKAACGVSSALKGSAAWAERLTATLVERTIELRAQQETALATVKAVHATCESRECTDRAAEATKEAEKAAEFCAHVEREARRLRNASRTITAKHRHMAGEIDGMIETLATHNRGAKDQNGVACIGTGEGEAEAASAIKSKLAAYRQTQLRECFSDNAEEKDTATFESELETHTAALTLFDGSEDTNAIVAGRDKQEQNCAFFTGGSATNAVLYSTRSGDTDVAATCGGMWQIAKTEDGQNVKLQAKGRDNSTLGTWKDQEDIAETLKTLKELAAAIRTPNRTNATTNCLHQLAKDEATLEDADLRRACSAFAFDAWLAKWTTREKSTQKSGARAKGHELPAPRSDERDNDTTPSERTESAGGFGTDTRTQSRAAETASVAAPLLLAKTLGLVRAAA
ncbi:hypothetical protein ERJ75_000692400 [Trypanosoma vivax]|uniref:Trypanosome variant surface glycoprotein B-type N-terminal domain-containing protein n=1 Tax=Trypanosoma vivax (strain Y486) TaxID=1055687 RepID=F9WNQ6_TRYVY|nr:hypothetical protein ERJ75_000692400 [Trypanosoma vivax]CCD19177.1 hypothetical protein, conserved in T. vivax [Trypanosoma vivax Y486]|eukprot:CCD19177.1 hypothetical protein, conserved in T. vivax [Trypanosoma vivax Y486]